ncbi:helix-turn-helix domain-containing protein [Streptomyces smaragdinus]|uniref:helix-turn-helix domain-containing protein n=1 Tax=Streptomyces smaragdinus TaxID=2585196 RepID=UPI0012976C1B|nr:helix-turn-helix transcriptional regulator [Streptomyces smaragdinus]
MAEKQKMTTGPAGEVLRQNIKNFREGKRITFAELSTRLADLGRPIPVLGLRRIERGERRVDVDDLIALSLALNASPGRLLLPPGEPQEDRQDGRQHWMPLTETVEVPWETAWRWMHGEYPPEDVSAREVREFRAENRPYEDPDPAREVGEMLRTRIDGPWELSASGDGESYAAQLVRHAKREG